jgi:hypothetical protein
MNEKTKLLLDAYCQRPNAPLLLVGKNYMGFRQCKDYLVEHLLSKVHRNNLVIVEPDTKHTIGVELIRTLKQSLYTRTDTVNEKHASRLAFIAQLESATTEAQNALLKLLEEPVSGTVIVMQTADIKAVAPTILSRAFAVPMLPLSKNQFAQLLKDSNIDEKKAEKLYLLSEGSYELLQNMLDEGDADASKIADAKRFLSLKPYDRLMLSKEYDTSAKLYELLNRLVVLCSAGMHNSSAKQAVRWREMLHTIRHVDVLLSCNVSAKALYLRLCVSL